MQGKARAGRDLRDAGDITGSCSPAVLPRTCSRRRRGGRRCRRTWPAACWYSRSCTGCRTGRPRKLFAFTFGGRGRGGGRGGVFHLREFYGLSDRQAADALCFDIRWKVACGRSLLETSFDPTALVHWRKRIAKSERPDRVFDAVRSEE